MIDIKWQEVITSIGTAVGGGGVLLATAAYLSKEIVTHKLRQEFAVFTTGLQTQANTEIEKLKASLNTEIEKLKASLQLIALEHQVRFAKLHEKRAEVIAEVYRQLLDVHRLAKLSSLASAYVDATTRQKTSADAMEAIQKLFDYVQQNRIYLPESLCVSVEDFWNALTREVIKSSKVAREDEITAQTRFNDAWETFDGEIRTLRKELENEFRGLLGVREQVVALGTDHE